MKPRVHNILKGTQLLSFQAKSGLDLLLVLFVFHILVFLADLGPIRADFPVGAELELTRLCGLWRREVSAALWVDHGGAVPKTLPALELPLLHARTARHAAL